MQRIRKISLGLLIAAVLLIPTSAWLLTPTPAHAAATPQSGGGTSVWCGDWYPNPDTLTDKQTVPNTQFVNTDSRSFAIFQGYDLRDHEWYYYAYEAHGTVGDQIALEWVYNGDNSWYQCGDASGGPTATVWSNTTDTWTAGVPAYQVLNPASHYLEISFWPAGSSQYTLIIFG